MCKVQLNFAYPAGARKVFSTLIRVIPKLPNNMKNNLIGSVLALCLSLISIIDSTAANVYPENPFLHLNQDAVEYFNISMDMSGYKFNSSDLTGKDIIDLFALIGPPQKNLVGLSMLTMWETICQGCSIRYIPASRYL